jgi:hypothetical protein
VPQESKKGSAKDKRMRAKVNAKAAIRAERAGAKVQASEFRRRAMKLNAEARKLMKK